MPLETLADWATPLALVILAVVPAAATVLLFTAPKNHANRGRTVQETIPPGHVRAIVWRPATAAELGAYADLSAAGQKAALAERRYRINPDNSQLQVPKETRLMRINQPLKRGPRGSARTRAGTPPGGRYIPRGAHWVVVRSGNDYHGIPVNDLRLHRVHQDCWCRPEHPDPHIYLHDALDQREKYETGERRVN